MRRLVGFTYDFSRSIAETFEYWLTEILVGGGTFSPPDQAEKYRWIQRERDRCAFVVLLYIHTLTCFQEMEAVLLGRHLFHCERLHAHRVLGDEKGNSRILHRFPSLSLSISFSKKSRLCARRRSRRRPSPSNSTIFLVDIIICVICLGLEEVWQSGGGQDDWTPTQWSDGVWNKYVKISEKIGLKTLAIGIFRSRWFGLGWTKFLGFLISGN